MCRRQRPRNESPAAEIVASFCGNFFVADHGRPGLVAHLRAQRLHTGHAVSMTEYEDVG
jgi:hypothetical protein